MVVFLQKYNTSQADEKRILENKLSCAIYDFLEDRKQEGREEELEKYNNTKNLLEKVAEESFLISEKTRTKELINLFSQGQERELFKEIRNYLLAIIRR